MRWPKPDDLRQWTPLTTKSYFAGGDEASSYFMVAFCLLAVLSMFAR